MVEVWNFCRIYIRQNESGNKITYRSAVAIVPDPESALEPGMKVTLLLKNKNGEVFQVVDGVVQRKWKNRRYVEVYIPWHVAEALAEWAGKKVDNTTKRLVLHDYAVKIGGVSTPPLR
jgi:hypothetical protein